MPTLTSEEIKRLVQKKLVVITGDVDDITYKNTSTVLLELLLAGSPDITVVIDSGGGNVGAGLDVYDLLKNYPGHTTGIVLRRAASMAAVILQACDERIAATHADILIHHISRDNVSLDVLNDATGQKLAELREGMLKRQNYLYVILAERTKKSVEEISKVCLKDVPMFAQEAMDFGLIDRTLLREDMSKRFHIDPDNGPTTK